MIYMKAQTINIQVSISFEETLDGFESIVFSETVVDFGRKNYSSRSIAHPSRKNRLSVMWARPPEIIPVKRCYSERLW